MQGGFAEALCLPGEPPQARPLLPDARTSTDPSFPIVSEEVFIVEAASRPWLQLQLAEAAMQSPSRPDEAEPKGLELDRADINAARSSRRRRNQTLWALAAAFQEGGSFASPVRGHRSTSRLLF